MTGRRQFLKETGVLGLGIAAGAGLPAEAGASGAQPNLQTLAAAAETVAPADARTGALPPITLLSIHHKGGVESLGIRFDDGVFDVAQASALLGLPAPNTLDQMLREGSWSQIEAVVAGTRTANLSQTLQAGTPPLLHRRATPLP